MQLEYSSSMKLVYESRGAAGEKIESRISPPTPYDIGTSSSLLDRFHHVKFDADFQGGKLYRAIQVNTLISVASAHVAFCVILERQI